MAQPYNTLPGADPSLNTVQQRVKTAIDSLRRDLQQALTAKADRAETVRTVTASASVTLDDRTVLCDPTSAAIVTTLPDARSCAGYRFTFKQITSNAHTVVVAPVAGQTLDGIANYTLGATNAVIDVVSDGRNWFVVT